MGVRKVVGLGVEGSSLAGLNLAGLEFLVIAVLRLDYLIEGVMSLN